MVVVGPGQLVILCLKLMLNQVRMLDLVEEDATASVLHVVECDARGVG